MTVVATSDYETDVVWKCVGSELYAFYTFITKTLKIDLKNGDKVYYHDMGLLDNCSDR